MKSLLNQITFNEFEIHVQVSIECQQEHRREPSGGSDNVVCSEEEEGDSISDNVGKNTLKSENGKNSFQDEDSYTSSTSGSRRQSPMLRGNQIRIEPGVPDLLK